jgi:hypothetical protein
MVLLKYYFVHVVGRCITRFPCMAAAGLHIYSYMHAPTEWSVVLSRWLVSSVVSIDDAAIPAPHAYVHMDVRLEVNATLVWKDRGHTIQCIAIRCNSRVWVGWGVGLCLTRLEYTIHYSFSSTLRASLETQILFEIEGNWRGN